MPAQQSPLSDRSAGSCQGEYSQCNYHCPVRTNIASLSPEGKHGQDVGLATHYSKPEDASCNHGKEAETIPSEQCGEHVYKHAPRSSEGDLKPFSHIVIKVLIESFALFRTNGA